MKLYLEVYNMITGGIAGASVDSIKTIYMYDLKGEYLRSFRGASSAATYLANKLGMDDIYTITKAIRNNCLETSNSSYGYYFSYKKEFNYKNSERIRAVA